MAGREKCDRVTLVATPGRNVGGGASCASNQGHADVEILEFPTKNRDELDRAINDFDRNLTHRLDELRMQFVCLGDLLMAMASREDQKYLSIRIAAVLRSHGMISDDATAARGISRAAG